MRLKYLLLNLENYIFFYLTAYFKTKFEFKFKMLKKFKVFFFVENLRVCIPPPPPVVIFAFKTEIENCVIKMQTPLLMCHSNFVI